MVLLWAIGLLEIQQSLKCWWRESCWQIAVGNPWSKGQQTLMSIPGGPWPGEAMPCGSWMLMPAGIRQDVQINFVLAREYQSEIMYAMERGEFYMGNHAG